MKRNRFSEAQIFEILQAGEAGISIADLCRKHGVGESTYYKWKSKYGGMQLSDLKRLEEENRRLKLLYAKVSLDNQILQEALEGKR